MPDGARGAAADKRAESGRTAGRHHRQEQGMLIVIGIVIGLVIGAAAAVVFLRVAGASRLGAAERRRDLLLAEARQEADATRREAQIEAREEAVRLRTDVEREVQERRTQILKTEERVLAKEEE